MLSPPRPRRGLPGPICTLLSAAAAFTIAAPTAAQNTDSHFTNYETPQVHPVESAVLTYPGGTMPVVFVCNTPNSSVELYEANTMLLLDSVRVGLGPATARYLNTLGTESLYTCNMDGDSVSRVVAIASAPGIARLELMRTTHVGDQPADVAVVPSTGALMVTLSGRSAFALLDATSLAPVPGSAPENILDVDASGLRIGIKEPRQIAVLGSHGVADQRVFVLNHRGGVSNSPLDADLYWFESTAGVLSEGIVPERVVPSIPGLGSTNHAFEIFDGGQRMAVVGTHARNDIFSESALAALPTGFVESWMWIVDIPANGIPQIVDVAGATTAAEPSMHLNQLSAGGTLNPTDALSQPTDIEVFDDGAGRVFALTAYHSDRVALLRPDASAPGGYNVTRIDLTPINSTYSMAGPRGIAFHPATGHLYVSCRLDNSIRVIDPGTGLNQGVELPSGLALAVDPTPLAIRAGRTFLYGAHHSGSHTVSCASCHIDGRIDGLAWDLTDPPLPGAAPRIPLGLHGGSPVTGNPSSSEFLKYFPDRKGLLMTQSLQGLVNDVLNESGQVFATNAPYHWRGDRGRFQDFLGAFQSLLGGPANGIKPSDMDMMTRFINTIRYTPNPEQARDRRVAGTYDPTKLPGKRSTGLLLGLETFHSEFVLNGTQTCSSCHALPVGSDGLLTEILDTFEGGSSTSLAQPFETAQLRGLFPRESQIADAPNLPVFVAARGLGHNGNDVINVGTVDQFVGGPAFAYSSPAARDANSAFVRQFDLGEAPAATFAFTLGSTLADDPDNKAALLELEQQVAEANCGLVAIVRGGPNHFGFWYDLEVDAYRLEGSTLLWQAAFLRNLALQPDVSVILQGTPPGDERRYASASGLPSANHNGGPGAPSPSNIEIQPMAPMTYYERIPLFTHNVQIDTSVTPPTVTANPDRSIWALRTFQVAVQGLFGVSSQPHHEPPRRLRVTGDDIRPGAKLRLYYGGALASGMLEFDIHMTKYVVDGKRVWESEEELAPMMTFFFLCGGPNGKDALSVLYRQFNTPQAGVPNLQPTQSNLYAWEVINEENGALPSLPVAAPLTVQDGR
ncbi:MAG: YncE family protein [Planctomycetota bacterium]